MMDHQQVLDFWRSIGPEGWFRRNDVVDEAIRTKFGALHQQAAAGGLASWGNEASPALALVIVLDQFSRNMFRNDPRAFAQDELACEIASAALAAGYDREVAPDLGTFFFMPFMHSERIAEQERCVRLFHAANEPESLKYAKTHRDVVRRFGRFPHRNPALGRHTTDAERAFLDGGGFSA
ncbi:MAG: DUF924 family protein [Nitratireductor sp.]